MIKQRGFFKLGVGPKQELKDLLNLNAQEENMQLLEKAHPASQGLERPSISKDQFIHQQTSRQFKKEAEKISHHIFTWWNDPTFPERSHFLTAIVRELPSDQDSEDEQGKPRYLAARCVEYKNFKAKLELDCRKQNEQRLKIMEWNKVAIQKGKQPMTVPAEVKIDLKTLEEKRVELEARYKARKEDEKMRKHKKWVQPEHLKGSHDPNNPFCTNQLNTSVLNLGLAFDRRVEMAIIAQQQRRRFNQVRQLGFKVPEEYKRIHSVLLFPKLIQEELVKYPEAIIQDPDYISDSEFLTNQPDIIKYIESSDYHKRAAIENGAEPQRYYNARKQKGELPFRDLFVYLKTLSQENALERLGMSKAMTQARRENTLKQPDIKLVREEYLKELCYQLQLYLETGKTLQQREATLLLKEFKDDYSMLHGKPLLIKALFISAGLAVPFDLRPYLAPQQEPISNFTPSRQISSEKKRKRRVESTIKEESKLDYTSSAREKVNSFNHSTDQNQPVPELLDEEEDYNERIVQDKSEFVQSKFKLSAVKPNLLNETDKTVGQALIDLIGQASSSYGSQIENELLSDTPSSSSDYIKAQQPLPPLLSPYKLEISEPKLDFVVPESQYFHLYESLSPFIQFKQSFVQNPVLEPKPLIIRQRDLNAEVSIDGQKLKWSDFRKQVQKQLKQSTDQSFSFILNQDEPDEKVLIYDRTRGFQEEDSDAEQTKRDRFTRQFIRERQIQHQKPFVIKRKIQEWEVYLLALFEKVVTKLLKKKIKSPTEVYMWQLPNEMPDFRVGQFLLKDHLNFTLLYEKEKKHQLQVVDNPNEVIFASELEQFWLVANQSCSKNVKAKLPQDWQWIHWVLNVDQMEKVVAQEENIVEQMENLSLGQEVENNTQQFDDIDDHITNPPQVEEENIDQIGIQEQSNLENVEEVSEQEEEEVVNKVQPKSKKKIYYEPVPESQLPGYQDLKRKKLLEQASDLPPLIDDLSTFLDETSLIKEQFPPAFLKENLFPRLQKVVDESEGRFVSFKIWAEFMGDDENDEHISNSYTMGFEDQSIWIDRVQIGKFVRDPKAFCMLLPQAWDGLGVPLQNYLTAEHKPGQKQPMQSKPQQVRNKSQRGKRTMQEFESNEAFVQQVMKSKVEQPALEQLRKTLQFVKDIANLKHVKVLRVGKSESEASIDFTLNKGEIKQTIALLKNVRGGQLCKVGEANPSLRVKAYKGSKLQADKPILNCAMVLNAGLTFTLSNIGVKPIDVRLSIKI